MSVIFFFFQIYLVIVFFFFLAMGFDPGFVGAWNFGGKRQITVKGWPYLAVGILWASKPFRRHLGRRNLGKSDRYLVPFLFTFFIYVFYP